MSEERPRTGTSSLNQFTYTKPTNQKSYYTYYRSMDAIIQAWCTSKKFYIILTVRQDYLRVDKETKDEDERMLI